MSHWRQADTRDGMILESTTTIWKGFRATARREPDGRWHVVWHDGENTVSNSGPISGVEDGKISSIWIIVDEGQIAKPDSGSLKVANSRPDAKACASCGGLLKEPWPGLKHCPKCEP